MTSPKFLRLTFDDKYKLKQIFKYNNLPCAEGSVFMLLNRRLLTLKIRFPILVVKPKLSSLSKHVACNIKTKLI